MDREVYKFRFPEMEQAAEAYMNFLKATFNYGDIEGKEPEEIMSNIKVKIGESVSGTASLAKALVPLGLRLKISELNEMDAEEALGYLPKILEVNEGFFTGLWGTWDKTITKLPTGKREKTPSSSPKDGEEQPTLTSVD